MGTLSAASRSYIAVVLLAGAGLFAYAAVQPRDWPPVLAFAVLVVLADAAPASLLRRGSHVVMLSVTFPIRMAAIVVTGPWGALIATTASLFAYARGGRALVKRLFNVAQCYIAVAAAGLVYEIGRAHV